MQGTDWTYLKSAPVNEQDDTQDRQADRQAGRQTDSFNKHSYIAVYAELHNFTST